MNVYDNVESRMKWVEKMENVLKEVNDTANAANNKLAGVLPGGVSGRLEDAQTED